MAARIFKLLGGSYHDDKGTLERGSLIISDVDMHTVHRGKFQSIVIEQLQRDQVEEYKEAIERFCEIRIVEKNGRFNTIGSGGVYILREWGAKTKATAAAKKERTKMDRRYKGFMARLDEVMPIITREVNYHELEADLDENDEPIRSTVDLTGEGSSAGTENTDVEG